MKILIPILLCIFHFPVLNIMAIQSDFWYLQGKDGLNDSEINSIAQDNNGMIWLATYSGLIKFDGFEFKQYRTELNNPGSLPDKKIRLLFIDSYNNLWVASRKHISRYIENTDSFVNYHFDNAPSIGIFIVNVSQVGNNILVHVIDEYDNIPDGYYVLPVSNIKEPNTGFKRLNAFHGNELATDYFSYITYLNDTTSLFVLNESEHSGSVLFSGKIKRIENKRIIDLTKITDINSEVNCINFVEQENNFYIGTQKGIFIFSLDYNRIMEKTFFLNHNIQHLIHTSNNNIFCSSDSHGLHFIDLHTGNTGSYLSDPNQTGTLLSNTIKALYEDFSGNLWIGHQEQGLSILNLYQKGFLTYRNNPLISKSLKNNSVTCFAATDGEVFIGTRGGISYTGKDIKPDNVPDFKEINLRLNGKLTRFENAVWDIEKQSDNLLWVASGIGLLKLQKINDEWQLEPYSELQIFNQLIRQIFIDDNNNIWFGSHSQGLILLPNPEINHPEIYFQYKTDINDNQTISDNIILTIFIDSRGNFWIGTENGLNLIDSNYKNLNLSRNIKPKLRFKRFNADSEMHSSLNNNEINCIFENFDGKIWIATQGGGINIFDPENEKFEYLTTDNGLPGNDIKGILADDLGKIWISTTKGLAVYMQHSNEPVFNYYTSNDGLQSNLFFMNSYMKTKDGEMFFGGDNGFTRFYPKNIKPNTTRPKIVFTDLNIGYKNIQVGDTIWGKNVLERNINLTEKIILPYKHENLGVGVAAIHYQFSNGNKIMYKLEGYDDNWNVMPAYFRNIHYSNLPPGEYTLEVKAISSDNITSENTRILSIEVLNPWYLKWYSIILFFLTSLIFISGIGYALYNRQKLMYHQKIDKLAIETTESKMMFLTNIAHGIKTPLSLVIAPIEDIIQNYHEIKTEWKNNLLLAQRNAYYLLKLTNQIIDFRKLDAGKLKLYKEKTDIVKLIKGVAENFNIYETRQKVKLNINIPYPLLEVYIDQQKIEEILYNLISNAFKNTTKNNNIFISLDIINDVDQTNKKKIRITVLNEGLVIANSEKEKIFERFYKTNEISEGAGIGLSFSKSLAELHGGNIEVERLNERGMAFHVIIPIGNKDIHALNHTFDVTTIPENTDDLFPEIPEPILITEDNKEHNNKEKLNVVLVEDNSELRNFLKKVLSKNYNCYTASNGVEGLEITKKIIPDIIISDIIMPEMDGSELCKTIKENIKTCHIPVILLTAKTSKEQIISGYNCGADAYITKPFDLNIISSQIERLIKNRELIRKKYQEQNFMIEVTGNELTIDDEFILKLRTIITDNISDPDFNVKSLGESMDVSSAQLYRKIKALTGCSPVEFIRIIKLQKAYELIIERKYNVKEVCYMSGFNNKSYFIKCFKEQFGLTPASLKGNGLLTNSE
jgi:signal transduction histidine kinase/ligand-binding sensor domain-containing protein/CheY-like chemotaxis protein/AraC-like DNA-binding protein